MRSLNIAILNLLIGAMGPQAWAASVGDSSDRASPTVFLDARGAYQTYKSEMVNSNDTGIGYSYTLGFHAGEERTIGVMVRTDSSTVSFKLNDASVATTWQDTIIRYRFGFFYIGGILGTVAMTSEFAGEDGTTTELDVVGSGFGGNTGVVFGIFRKGAYYLDVSSVTISEAREANQADVSFGPRLDIDTGVLFNLSRETFDLVFGLSSRSFGIETTSSYSEAITSTYLGFRINAFF